MFLEAERPPPDFKISPSWGVAQKEASVFHYFFFLYNIVSIWFN